MVSNENSVSQTRTYHDQREQEAQLHVGREVTVRWGCGQGFRAVGRGKIVKMYAKSVRVELLDDVMSGEHVGWAKGFVLQGIPRFDVRARQVDQWNGVTPV